MEEKQYRPKWMTVLVNSFKKLLVYLHFFIANFREKSPVIAIGDSWFNLTFFNFNSIKKIDILDWLKKDGFNIVDCAIPGYKFEHEQVFKLYKYPVTKMAKQKKKCLVLLSLGGNDYIWDYVGKVIYLDDDGKVSIKREQLEGITNKFMTDMGLYIHDIAKTYIDNGGKSSDINIVIHGYAYPNALKDYFGAGGDGSLTKLFNKFGKITDEEINILTLLILDVFNEGLQNLKKINSTMHYVDLRGVLNKEDFFEDIHPSPKGYLKAARTIELYLKLNGID